MVKLLKVWNQTHTVWGSHNPALFLTN